MTMATVAYMSMVGELHIFFCELLQVCLEICIKSNLVRQTFMKELVLVLKEHCATMNYIFPRPRKVCPRDRTEVKTDFFFREKVLLSEIVGKKDRVEQLSNRAERLSSLASLGKTAKRS